MPTIPHRDSSKQHDVQDQLDLLLKKLQQYKEFLTVQQNDRILLLEFQEQKVGSIKALKLIDKSQDGNNQVLLNFINRYQAHLSSYKDPIITRYRNRINQIDSIIEVIYLANNSTLDEFARHLDLLIKNVIKIRNIEKESLNSVKQLTDEGMKQNYPRETSKSVLKELDCLPMFLLEYQRYINSSYRNEEEFLKFFQNFSLLHNHTETQKPSLEQQAQEEEMVSFEVQTLATPEQKSMPPLLSPRVSQKSAERPILHTKVLPMSNPDAPALTAISITTSTIKPAGPLGSIDDLDKVDKLDKVEEHVVLPAYLQRQKQQNKNKPESSMSSKVTTVDEKLLDQLLEKTNRKFEDSKQYGKKIVDHSKLYSQQKNKYKYSGEQIAAFHDSKSEIYNSDYISQKANKDSKDFVIAHTTLEKEKLVTVAFHPETKQEPPKLIIRKEEKGNENNSIDIMLSLAMEAKKLLGSSAKMTISIPKLPISNQNNYIKDVAEILAKAKPLGLIIIVQYPQVDIEDPMYQEFKKDLNDELYKKNYNINPALEPSHAKFDPG